MKTMRIVLRVTVTGDTPVGGEPIPDADLPSVVADYVQELVMDNWRDKHGQAPPLAGCVALGPLSGPVEEINNAPRGGLSADIAAVLSRN